MKSVGQLAVGLCLACAAALVFAQSPRTGDQPVRRPKLDANGDGVIDRSEAAKMPKFAERFETLDANKDGRITAEERPQRGRRERGHGHGGGIARLDSNGDGAVDRGEADGAPKLAEHFDRLDADRDGRITREERPHRNGRRMGDQGARMARLDTNGDGRFSRDELAGKERMLEKFAAIDGDRDGFVTRDELRAYRQAHRGERKPQP